MLKSQIKCGARVLNAWKCLNFSSDTPEVLVLCYFSYCYQSTAMNVMVSVCTYLM